MTAAADADGLSPEFANTSLPGDAAAPAPVGSAIPDNADQDIPPDGEEPRIPETDPAAEHARRIDWIKLSFATKLIAGCVIAVVVLSGAQYGLQSVLPDGAELPAAIDWIKLVASTALGYVFGRSFEQRDEKP